MTAAPKIAEPVTQTSANPKKSFFQAKLTVNEPGDVYEQEADAVADRVMRMPDPAAADANLPFNKVSIASLQRKCASCEEEEKGQRKESEEDEQPVQLKRISDLVIQRQCADCEEEIQRKEAGITGGGMTAPSIVSEVISENGSPLDKGTRQFMESRMGQDFSGVQIHTDGNAAASAQSINALAYTSGNHIVFNSGQYQPGSESGKRLLAHELVHVGQQNGVSDVISRATYEVGSSRVQIDYGDVVYHDNMLEYDQEIHRRYSQYLAPEAPSGLNLHSLYNSQKRWLLYAIDLLIENPISAVNKSALVNKLVRYVPNAIYEPLRGYNANKPVFNFENEVLRASGWFEFALASGISLPSSEDQRMLNFLYNQEVDNNSSSNSTCPTTRSASQTLDEARLRHELPLLIGTYLSDRVTAYRSVPAQTQNLTDMSPIADIVQAEALRFFAPFIGSGRGQQFLQGWRYGSHLIASTSPSAIPPQARRSYLLNRANNVGGSSLYNQVHFDPRCQTDRSVLSNIIDELDNDSLIQSQLDIIMSRQTFTERDPGVNAHTVLNLQARNNTGACSHRWQLINSLCHELIHVYVHTAFYNLAMGRQIITEGFTEVLGDQLYTEIRRKALSDAQYRAGFGQGTNGSACENFAIPPPVTEYGDFGANADRLRLLVGDTAFRAAYFLGRTSLVGLQSPVQRQTTGVVQRNGNPQSGPTSAPFVVIQARQRLARLLSMRDELLNRRHQIEIDKTRMTSLRTQMDDGLPEPPGMRQRMERTNIRQLNREALTIVTTPASIQFLIRFQVRFEDASMRSRFDELVASMRTGIRLVWNQTLSDQSFSGMQGRRFEVIPTFTLMDSQTIRDRNFWLLTVRPVDRGNVQYPNCTPHTFEAAMPPTSVTDSSCDGGTMSIPPRHISLPGVLGHETLHLFGLVDRYAILTHTPPNQAAYVTTAPSRETGRRKDPLGSEEGTIIDEDLGFLFQELGVFDQVMAEETALLPSLELEITHLQDIIRLGYDPRTLIRYRTNFNDRMLRDADNL